MKKIIYVLLITLCVSLAVGCGKERYIDLYKIYNEAIRLTEEKKYQEAYDLVVPYANKNHGGIESLMGTFYYNGNVVERNYETALIWFKKSAEHEFPLGEYMTGTCYLLGNGVEKNGKEAIKWYKKAADHEYARAYSELAWIYIYGEITHKNYEESIRFAKLLLETDRKELGEYIIGYCYDNGYYYEKSEKEAFTWYKKCAVKGNSICQFKVGMFYNIGTGVTKNRAEARKWLKKSSEQGYEDATDYLKKNFD